MASLYFVAGVFGAIANPIANVPVAISLVAAAVYFLTVFVRMPLHTGWFGRTLWLLLLLVLVTEILLCLVPPTARDELTHHLAIPRLYVRSGKIVEVPMALYSYYPVLDMLYTPWVGWGSIGPKARALSFRIFDGTYSVRVFVPPHERRLRSSGFFFLRHAARRIASEPLGIC